jgi:hypothetical protein
MLGDSAGLGSKSPSIFSEGIRNAAGYRTMLSANSIFMGMKDQFAGHWIWFQQDGAPAYTAKTRRKFIQEQIGLIQNWPANSPDLSVIENVWRF